MLNSAINHVTILKVERTPNPKLLIGTSQIRQQQQFRQLINFGSLMLGLGGGAGLFIWFWPDKLMLRFATVILVIFYVVWGVLTHAKNQTLVARVFWEYFSIAILGGLMLWLVI